MHLFQNKRVQIAWLKLRRNIFRGLELRVNRIYELFIKLNQQNYLLKFEEVEHALVSQVHCTGIVPAFLQRISINESVDYNYNYKYKYSSSIISYYISRIYKGFLTFFLTYYQQFIQSYYSQYIKNCIFSIKSKQRGINLVRQGYHLNIQYVYFFSLIYFSQFQFALFLSLFMFCFFQSNNEIFFARLCLFSADYVLFNFKLQYILM
eukprot:TRINITY_DN14319_c1_g1_i3.p2 TRINITY_DN14319_c1_g1~~TRINITY_DN14319_c1_g1_i3.p2  ORF type:complete len:207 (+),score=-18.65 TRINITY_DN14319_c1_g1_i3:806-1426(+)